MFGNFKEDARRVLVAAKKEMYELKHPYIGSEHLLLAILKESETIAKKLKEYNLTYERLKKEIIDVVGVGNVESKWFLYTPLLKRVIENAISDSKENNNGEVTTEHLFSSLLEEGEGVAIRILLGMDIDIESLYKEFTYKIANNTYKKKYKKLLLEELGVDITKKALNNELDPVVGREKEIKRVLEILLRRTKNNPILVGEAGVGKTAIVEELSRIIVNDEVPQALRGKRIISLDMATAVAGTKYRGEFEERIRKILKEIEENDDIILFIDEIHTLVGAGGAEGAIDASNIFKPALARNKLRCIGATTISEYKKYIEADSALERRFQKVIIEAPDKETVKEILLKQRDVYSKYHNVVVSDEIVDLIIELSEKYIYDRNQPDKAIDVLDEVCASVSLKESKELKKYNKLNRELNEIIKIKNHLIIENNFEEAEKYKMRENELMDKLNSIELSLGSCETKEVTKRDVAEVIHLKTKIPVYEILNDNKQVIDRISKNMHERIVGQNKVIKELVDVVKKIKLGFKEENKCYSMMFSGPSGVGKTELAKVFGENLVGKNNVIRLDMSEFSESHSVSKIVGAPPGYVGYSDNKNISEEIRNKPNSVLILDEIEKANPAVINLLFQILDEGCLKDSKGINVRFDNVIIIMTSNIGFTDISIGFNKDKKDSVLNKLKEYFTVPFINRIDNIIVFDSLEQETIEKLIKDKMNKLKNKYRKKGITISYSKNIVNELLKLTNYEEFGARKIDKLIKDKIENIVIENVINDKNKINIKTIELSLV